MKGRHGHKKERDMTGISRSLNIRNNVYLKS